MATIYEDMSWADVVVFVSPQFRGTVSGQLKVVFDRLFAWFNKVGWEKSRKKSIFLMTARGDDYSMALDFYGILERSLAGKTLVPFLEQGKKMKQK